MASSLVSSSSAVAKTLYLGFGLPSYNGPDLRRSSVGFRVRAVAGAESEPDLRVRVNGLEMPNPFVIGSGPPGTNYTVMKRAFDEGWGGVIAKTVL